MTDSVDQAQKTEEHLTNVMINNVKSKQPVIEDKGYCLFCGEPMEEAGRRFCDRDCCALYEREMKIKGVSV